MITRPVPNPHTYSDGGIDAVDLPDRRLYPAIDAWHEPDADPSVERDEAECKLLGERPMYLAHQALYSEGESFEHWRQRVGRGDFS